MKTLAIGLIGLDRDYAVSVEKTLVAADISFSMHPDIKIEEWNPVVAPDLIIMQEPVDEYEQWADAGLPTIFVSEKANGLIRMGNHHYILPHSSLDELPNLIKSEFQENNNLQDTAAIPARVFHSIVNKSVNEIYLLDLNSLSFQYGNSSLIKNLGFSRKEFLGLTFKDLFTEKYQRTSTDLLEPILNRELNTITFQADHQRTDESYYPVHTQLSRISKGGTEYIVGISSDLSELKRSANLLEERKEIARKLQLSNKYKSTFFANLSHEMRTTLNSMLLLSEILSENRQGNFSDDEIGHIDTIQNSTNSLLTLLNEILDFSKIESGKMSMRPEYVDSIALCKDLERLFQPVASEKGLQFEFINELSEEIPFKTDRLRVEQVLKNFISNALKFTKVGSIKLKVFRPGTVNGKDKNSDYIAFQVADTGMGVPKEKQKTIFKSFMQADDDVTEKEFGGTGLGLAISQNIADLLGGKITLKSTVGKGSKFTIILPTDSSEAILKNATEGKIKLTTTPASRDISKPDKTKPVDKIDGTVLLVDDNKTHNMALSEFLSFKISNCITADSAASAYEKLKEHDVNCIILDMYLPDASGKEVIKELKGNEQYATIPIIIYSGKNIGGPEEEELENMADAIIQKNVMSFRVLLSKLMGVLQKATEKNR